MPFGIVILAGGRAKRFPGKLMVDAGGVPMIVRVLSNVRDASDEIVVATNRELAPELASLVDVPVVVDAEPDRGPVAGLLAAFATMESNPILVLAGDMPFFDATHANRLYTMWERAGERDALVPSYVDDGVPRREPLAALYDRTAFLRAAPGILRDGDGAVHRVLESFSRKAFHRMDDVRFAFTNVNTPDDYAAFRTRFARPRGEPA